AVSSPRTAVVLIKYRLRRLVNMSGSGVFRNRNKKRAATPQKSMRSWVTASVLGLLIFFAFGMQANTVVTKLFGVMESVERSNDQEVVPAWDCDNSSKWLDAHNIECLPADKLSGHVVSPNLYGALVLELLLLFTTMLVISIAARELASPEWDLEWLST